MTASNPASNPFSLHGKVALVTGASTGLGQGLAIALAQAGADIVGIARSSTADAERGVTAAGRKFHALHSDLERRHEPANVVAQAIKVAGRVDILAMPTTPQKPFKLVADPDLKRIVGRARDMTANTSAFDLTGHPALTVPCGFSAGLPVGLQLVGRHWEEPLLFSVGQAVEQAQG